MLGGPRLFLACGLFAVSDHRPGALPPSPLHPDHRPWPPHQRLDRHLVNTRAPLRSSCERGPARRRKLPPLTSRQDGGHAAARHRSPGTLPEHRPARHGLPRRPRPPRGPARRGGAAAARRAAADHRQRLLPDGHLRRPLRAAAGTGGARTELAGRGPARRVLLIGGLGVGFSLAEAAAEPRWGRITVVERERGDHRLAPRRRPLSRVSGRGAAPTRARRLVRRRPRGVPARVGGTPDERFDALCLDIDNGPDWTVTEDNASPLLPRRTRRLPRARSPPAECSPCGPRSRRRHSRMPAECRIQPGSDRRDPRRPRRPRRGPLRSTDRHSRSRHAALTLLQAHTDKPRGQQGRGRMDQKNTTSDT